LGDQGIGHRYDHIREVGAAAGDHIHDTEIEEEVVIRDIEDRAPGVLDAQRRNTPALEERDAAHSRLHEVIENNRGIGTKSQGFFSYLLVASTLRIGMITLMFYLTLNAHQM